MSLNDPAYSPEPYAHAVRHLDAAEDIATEKLAIAAVEALLGIGWALLAVAKNG